MTELGIAAWPPAPIRTERLVLREPEARDRAAVIELPASPEVGSYLGGPRPRDEIERAMRAMKDHQVVCDHIDVHGETSTRRLFSNQLVDQAKHLSSTATWSSGTAPGGSHERAREPERR